MIPKPGIYRGISFAEYREWDALNKSSLDHMHEHSPAHYRYRLDNPEDESEDLVLGRALHTLALEGVAAFDREFTVGGPINPKTRECYGRDTKAFAWWLASQPKGKSYLSKEAHMQMCMMCAELRSSPSARAFLDDTGDNELSLLWTDSGEDGTGLACKARIDIYRPGWECIADLKTTKDASPDAFGRSIDNYGYHRQGAWYMEGAKALGLPVKNFAFVCVEKTPPYAIAMYRLSNSTIDIGRHQNRRLLQTVAECRRTGIWPGYGQEFADIGLPDYAVRREMKQ